MKLVASKKYIPSLELEQQFIHSLTGCIRGQALFVENIPSPPLPLGRMEFKMMLAFGQRFWISSAIRMLPAAIAPEEHSMVGVGI
jgi:hypothetical protein